MWRFATLPALIGLCVAAGLALSPPVVGHDPQNAPGALGDPQRGRQLFLDKGCVTCHVVNGVGGSLGPGLNAASMPQPVDVLEYAAGMWRGAPAMSAIQEDLFGELADLDGEDLADLIAFSYDAAEQARLTPDQVPDRFRMLMQGQ